MEDLLSISNKPQSMGRLPRFPGIMMPVKSYMAELPL